MTTPTPVLLPAGFTWKDVADGCVLLAGGTRVLEVIRQTVRPHEQADVLSLMEQMDAHHPREPHWHLPMIGVDPSRQGQGRGSALLRHALERCDRESALAYLESSSPANIPLYERFGFELIGTIQSGSSPQLWPMVRVPR